MASWFIMTKRADFETIAERYRISPILARIIRNRDVCTPEEIQTYLYGKMEDLCDPLLMKNMSQAVTFIKNAIQKKIKIRIIGDYDVDGICSTYILFHGLSSIGACVDTDIPHRMKDGYGLNERLIKKAAEDGVQLIITCDNGIAAAKEIELAYQLGISVIVTDHHEVPFEIVGDKRIEILPMAEVIVDPKQTACQYPFKGICGAVVVWKLLQALEVPAEVLGETLEAAAFATVCDVMELQKENRILLKEGLKRMRQTTNVGLRALMDVCGIEYKKLEVYHIGFVLGPCMNATGRLESAKLAFELWCCKNREEAVKIATELKNLNDSRKEMTEYGVNQSIQKIEEQGKLDKVLVIYLPECHESIAGIIAGRLREKYDRPVFVLTKSEEGVKGSGRSIEQYDMYEALTKCKELFTKFGGHKMAAGISLPENNVTLLRDRLNANCELVEEDFIKKVYIDIALPISYVTETFVEEMKMLEPFGNGNTKPVFAQKKVVVQQVYVLGKNRNVLRLRIIDDMGKLNEMIYFGDIPAFQKFMKEEFGTKGEEIFRRAVEGVYFAITYYPSISEYRGKRTCQVVMTNYSRSA